MKTVENVKVTENVEVTQKQCIDLRSCFCNTHTDNANMGRAESIELVDSVNYYSTQKYNQIETDENNFIENNFEDDNDDEVY